MIVDFKCLYYYYKGVLMTLRGETKLVKGGVLYVLADTLAAHQLGGFKIGVGFALRKC